MRRIADSLIIYDALSNEPWIQDGAAVRVAIVCFSRVLGEWRTPRLNGEVVDHINPNLTTGLDVSVAESLDEDDGASLLGIQESGPFDIPGELAREWLSLPLNPNGNAHRDLDTAVAAAYGWPANLTDEQILERLFALNQARASLQ
jgi:hypothetical protein